MRLSRIVMHRAMLRGVVAAALVLGEYEAALAAFKKAYLSYEEPVFLFNIAQCYRAMGDRAAAVRSYRAFLRNWPKAPNREQVERIVAELESAMAQEQQAKPAPPQETPSPPKSGEPPTPEAAHAEAQPKPEPSTEPEAATKQTSEPRATATAQPATPPKHDELVGMVEIQPNFDRPSGSTAPVRWWAWTLIALGVGGLAAARRGHRGHAVEREVGHAADVPGPLSSATLNQPQQIVLSPTADLLVATPREQSILRIRLP